jgi:FixJ family two-component response regulator
MWYFLYDSDPAGWSRRGLFTRVEDRMAGALIGEKSASVAVSATSSTVIIIDDDIGVREALEDLFASMGLNVLVYPSTQDFLASSLPDTPSCLILDVRMPGESGLDLQDRLAAEGVKLPIIFITGFADVPMTVRAMRSGAINFLAKPFRDQDVLEAVWEALRFDAERRETDKGQDELLLLAKSLTAREIDVLREVDRGLLNKQIAFELGISEITVKMHRSNAFKKLKAKTVSDMIHKVRALRL